MNEDGMPATQASWPQLWLELAGGLAVTIALGALAASVMALPLRVAGVAAVVMAAVGALILHVWPDTRRGLGPANRVTLLRAALVALVAGALAAPAWAQQHATALALVAALALLMDGVDGWVARRCGCESAFGARFDMELDAFLILILCVHLLLMDKAGPWVLAIGAMRYGFVAAMLVWPWLDGPLPESRRRKLVCVWQVASLLVSLLPMVKPALAVPLLVLALALLAWSFAVDVRWRRAHGRVDA